MLPLAILLIPIVCLALLLRITSKRTIVSGPDAFYHLLVADEIKEFGRKKFLGKYFVGIPDQTYPSFFGAVLSVLLRVLSPTSIIRYLAPAIDCLNLLIIYSFTSGLSSESIGLMAALLYAVIPLAVTNSFALSPRQLAVFLFTLCAYSLWVAYWQSSVIYFVLSVVALSLLLMTHKSSTQAIFGVLFFLSLGLAFVGSAFFLFSVSAILLSVTINFLVFRKQYIENMKDHIQFILNQPSGSFNLNTVLTSPPFMFGLLFSILSLLKVLSDFGLLKIGLFIPSLAPFVWFSVLQLVGLVLFYSLSYWGRCDWYFIHASAPSCFLTAILIEEWVTPPTNYLLVAAIVIASVFVDLRVARNYKLGSIVVDKSLLSFLQLLSVEKEACIMCIPSYYCYLIAYYSKKRVLYGNVNSWSVSFSSLLGKAYVDLEKGRAELVKKYLIDYHVTHIFVDTRRFNPDSLRKLQCRLTKSEGNYELYKIAVFNGAHVTYGLQNMSLDGEIKVNVYEQSK